MTSSREDEYGRSDQLLAAKGKSFYWARFFLIKKYAVRATRLYGFCRYIDDVADDSPTADGARAELARIVGDLKANTSDDPRVRDALALFHECQIDLVIPLELIAGVLSDLDRVPGIAQMNKIGPFDDSTLMNVQARNHSFCQHEPPPFTHTYER